MKNNTDNEAADDDEDADEEEEVSKRNKIETKEYPNLDEKLSGNEDSFRSRSGSESDAGSSPPPASQHKALKKVVDLSDSDFENPAENASGRKMDMSPEATKDGEDVDKEAGTNVKDAKKKKLSRKRKWTFLFFYFQLVISEYE